MRAYLSIALITLCATMAHAQDSAKAKASAALALTHAQRLRDQVKQDASLPPACDAKCKAALLLATVQRERSDREGCMTDLQAAIARSEKEGKHLFVWVGMTCDKAIRDEFKDAVHVHCDTLNGSKEPRLIVGASQPNLRLMKSELGKAAPAIRQFLQPPAKKLSSIAEPLPLPMMQPVMFQPIASC